MNKKAINADRARQIEEVLSTYEGRKKLIVACYFPLERALNPFETEEQRIERRFKQIEDMQGV